jgi:hypothetical protein
MSTEIAALLDRIPWTPLDPPVLAGRAAEPYPTHEGYLPIAGQELRVFRMSSGDRVVDPVSLSTSEPPQPAHRESQPCRG